MFTFNNNNNNNISNSDCFLGETGEIQGTCFAYGCPGALAQCMVP